MTHLTVLINLTKVHISIILRFTATKYSGLHFLLQVQILVIVYMMARRSCLAPWIVAVGGRKYITIYCTGPCLTEVPQETRTPTSDCYTELSAWSKMKSEMTKIKPTLSNFLMSKNTG